MIGKRKDIGKITGLIWEDVLCQNNGLCFLFQKSFGTSGVNAIGSFQLSQLNSSSVQSKLKAAGINTNSKQYKAAVKQMMSAGNGAMYGNIQGIKI